jgi:hypothetical protein
LVSCRRPLQTEHHGRRRRALRLAARCNPNTTAHLQRRHVPKVALDLEVHIAAARADGVHDLAEVLGVPDVGAEGRADLDDLVAGLRGGGSKGCFELSGV